MSPLAIAKVAGRALVRNKLRSALTTLGVVIGVGAVIAMVAIGEGARRRVEATFEAMGTNLLITAGLGGYLSGAVFLSATAADQTQRAERQVTSLLRDRHHVPPGAEDDFSVRNLSEIAAAQQEGTQILTTLLAAIAAVSLLVGGIGIMNIMLVSVTERTREIGVRMAVGARSWDVLAQFLAEAVALSLAGGLLGIAFGLVAAGQLAAHFHWPFLVHVNVLAISVGFSALVGIVFGFFPARKAARRGPIEALRFE